MKDRNKADAVGHARTAAVAPVVAPNITARPPTPPPPPTLSQAGQELWKEVWEGGGDAYWPHTDRHIIQRYCELTDRRRGFLYTLNTEGWTTTGSQGQEVAHPVAKFINDVEAKLLQLEDRLGLNPGDRLRLGITALEHKSRLDKFKEDEE